MSGISGRAGRRRTGPGTVDTTAAGLLTELLRRVLALRPGDTLIVYFAGHGYRTAVHDDPVTWSEALVCSDQPLDDSVTRTLREQLPSGATLVFIVDACHAEGFILGMAPLAPAPTEFVERPDSAILWWSACRDEESAYENADRGGQYGVFTESLTRAWPSAGTSSYHVLWQSTWRELRSKFPEFRQTPLLRLEAPTAQLFDRPAFR